MNETVELTPVEMEMIAKFRKEQAEAIELAEKEEQLAAEQEQIQAVEHEKKMISFSKQVMKAVMGIALIVIFYSMLIMWEQHDLSALPTLITSTLTFSSVAVGFYSAKAAAENVTKFNQHII